MYIFRNKSDDESRIYSDAKNLGFAWDLTYLKKNNFKISSDINFQGKSTIDLAKFIYFILAYYCNPKDQIKNRLKQKNVENLDEEYRNVIEHTQFKHSDTRYREIKRKKKILPLRVVTFSAITVMTMILILLFVDFGYIILNGITYLVCVHLVWI
jgi:hypothetical protein